MSPTKKYVGKAASPSAKSHNSRKSADGALKNEALKVSPKHEGLTKKQCQELLYFMLLTRRTEERLMTLHKQGKLISTLFRSLGQEATATGAAYALEPQDVLSPMIRDVSALFVKGHTVKDLFLQYLGRASAPTKGKDGNQHFGDIKKGTISCISHMGATIPVTMGAAFALNYKGIKAVGLTFVGDGGTSVGDFHEGLNMASVLKLPLILIAEHNNWAYSTPTTNQMNIKDISVRAQGYGIPGYTIDGNDVLEVYQTVKKSRKYVVEGNGPVLIEVKTMRMRGHAEHDDFYYVPNKMLTEWQKKDPIQRYIGYLKQENLMTDKEYKDLETKIARIVDEAEMFALKEPFPDPQTALEGVFQDPPKPDPDPWWME